ncbi:MAG: dipicolinate synthase subunit DpsA [Clostridia bacterium]|nr:dipicolinate synthase subunit DpsA [Clostridia bacterium]
MKNKTFLFIGGDLRQITAANTLSKSVNACVYGFDNHVSERFDRSVVALENIDNIDFVDYIVLPLPYSLVKNQINCPYFERKIYVTDVISKAKHQKIFAGKADDFLKSIAQENQVIDYLEREEFAVLNAIPTAEGAIKIAIDETSGTLNNANCLVLGYGRIGRVLTGILQGFGAKTTVFARKPKDFAYLKALGVNFGGYKELKDKAKDADIIFNTVPQKVIDYEVLNNLDKDALVIDLASKPGGVDFDSAKILGKKVIWALSLPGKIAPKTAGEIIAETLSNIINELEV